MQEPSNSKERPRMLGCTHYWDHPIAGLAEYKGEKFYFERTTGNDHLAFNQYPNSVRQEITKMPEEDEKMFEGYYIMKYFHNNKFEVVVIDKWRCNLYRVPKEIIEVYSNFIDSPVPKPTQPSIENFSKEFIGSFVTDDFIDYGNK